MRWDPGWLADRARRATRASACRRRCGWLGFAAVVQRSRGPGPAACPLQAQVLGPMPLDAWSRGGTAVPPAAMSASDDDPGSWHALVRGPLEVTAELTEALAALRAVRSARKEADVVMVRVDPVDGW